MNNPLLQKWDTPFETPPFNSILKSHYKPAIEETIKSATGEIKEITENPDGATFENTVATLDRAGESLGRISSILFSRIKTVYDAKDSSGLTTEQLMLLERKFRNFMLGGAGLDEKSRQRFR